jgi:hypothetical protein
MPNEAGQIAEAIAGAPIETADYTTALETAKEKTMQADDAILLRLAPALASNPALASSPALLREIGPMLQRRGLTVPTGPDGKVDATSLVSMLSPKKAATEMTDAFIQSVIEQPMDSPTNHVRKAMLGNFSGYDPELLTVPQSLSQVAQTAVRKNYDTKYFQAVNGNMTPAEFISWMDSERGALVGSNIDPSVLESDPSVMSGMGARVRADIERISLLGGKYGADIAKANAEIATATTVQELNRIRGKYLGAQIHHLSAMEQTALMNANSNATRASAYSADVGQRIANAQNGSWADRQRLLTTDLKTVVDERNKAATDERMLTIAAQTARTAGEDPGADLLDAITAATANKNALSKIITQIKDPATAAKAIGTALSSASGNAVRITGIENGVKFDSSLALQNKTNHNLWMMPDHSVWDTSAKPPKMVQPPG